MTTHWTKEQQERYAELMRVAEQDPKKCQFGYWGTTVHGEPGVMISLGMAFPDPGQVIGQRVWAVAIHQPTGNPELLMGEREIIGEVLPYEALDPRLGARLGRRDLAGADLSRFDFCNADLRQANLLSANLREAFLKKANLSHALLAEADLTGANLEDAEIRYAHLSNATLRDAYLRGADLRGAGLHGADLRGATLWESDLYGAKLSGADLRGASLCSANLREASLDGADLRGADLEGAELNPATDCRKDADLTGALADKAPPGWTLVDGRLQPEGCTASKE